MLDLSAVFQSHPDIALVVDRDVIDHRQPVSVPELCQRLSAPQVFQVRFDLVLSGHALGNQVGDLDVSGFCLIEPGYQGFDPPRQMAVHDVPALEAAAKAVGG